MKAYNHARQADHRYQSCRLILVRIRLYAHESILNKSLSDTSLGVDMMYPQPKLTSTRSSSDLHKKSAPGLSVFLTCLWSALVQLPGIEKHHSLPLNILPCAIGSSDCTSHFVRPLEKGSLLPCPTGHNDPVSRRNLEKRICTVQPSSSAKVSCRAPTFLSGKGGLTCQYHSIGST